MNSLRTLTSLAYDDITVIIDVIRRPHGLVSRRMPDKVNQIFVLVIKHVKLTVFVFKTMEHCSKHHDNYHLNSRRVLENLHQSDLEQKKDRCIIVLHLKLMRGVQGVSLDYVVKQHIKVVHILPDYEADLNLDEEMIASSLMVDMESNFKMTQDCLVRAYVSLLQYIQD